MTLLAHIENVIATYEAKILQLQQEILDFKAAVGRNKGFKSKER